MTYQYEVGDIVKLKKKHPCGSFEWEILRVGADFRLKCQGCGHQIMVARKIVEKNTKDLKKHLPEAGKYGSIENRDIQYPCSLQDEQRAKRPQGGKNSMNKYELALIVSAKIEDDARAAVVEKAKEYITRFGGTVTEVEDWGKKKLAYDIQKMSEGFYYFIQFDAAAEVPAELEQSVRIMDNVLRFLCVRKDEA